MTYDYCLLLSVTVRYCPLLCAPQVNLMTYDYNGHWATLTGFNQGRTWCTPTPCTSPSVHC